MNSRHSPYANPRAKRAHSSRAAGDDRRRARSPRRFTRPTPPSSSTSTTSRWGSAPTSDKELRSLLNVDIIKGKVAVQRAYADWRRYPQYIVPLSESSIDLIFAPAFGSSKKNATDIRLAIDAIELVFTRPEIGTFILLSGDSDFSSLVIKLKEYGKYVIGVGIRESASDLLDPELRRVLQLQRARRAREGSPRTSPRASAIRGSWSREAVQRMKRNNDVMRSDRLKQVMQQIDSTFDEKNLGISKFSRFCQEAAQKGLLAVTKLENGQLEVDLPSRYADGAAHRSRFAPSQLRPRPRVPSAAGGAKSVGRVVVGAGAVDVAAIAKRASRVQPVVPAL